MRGELVGFVCCVICSPKWPFFQVLQAKVSWKVLQFLAVPSSLPTGRLCTDAEHTLSCEFSQVEKKLNFSKFDFELRRSSVPMTGVAYRPARLTN